MKASSATSARATPTRRTGQSSAKPRLTRTNADEFTLSGPSNLPDPEFNAYRTDLADVALASRVIASHYSEPLERVIVERAELRSAPANNADVIAQLDPGTPFQMLDNALGWAWGYAGRDRRVGYVKSGAVGAP